MTCSACAKRRKALQAIRDKKKKQGKSVQAVAVGAVLAVSEVVGKISGEEKEDGRGSGKNQEGS